MNTPESKFERVEELISHFDLPTRNAGFDEQVLVLVEACDIVSASMNDFTGNSLITRKRLARVLADKLYNYVFDTMIALDYINSTIELGFYKAYEMAKLCYDPNEGHLKKFIDEPLYLARQKDNQALVAQLTKELAALEK